MDLAITATALAVLFTSASMKSELETPEVREDLHNFQSSPIHGDV